MTEFNPSLHLEDVGLLSDAVRTWYRHNGVAPTQASTQLLCSAVVEFYNQGHKTREELTTLLIMKFDSPNALKINAPSSASHH